MTCWPWQQPWHNKWWHKSNWAFGKFAHPKSTVWDNASTKGILCVVFKISSSGSFIMDGLSLYFHTVYSLLTASYTVLATVLSCPSIVRIPACKTEKAEYNLSSPHRLTSPPFPVFMYCPPILPAHLPSSPPEREDDLFTRWRSSSDRHGHNMSAQTLTTCQ